MAWTGAWSARAQDSSQPPSVPRALNLEYSGPTPGTPAGSNAGATATAPGGGGPVVPTPPGLDDRGIRGHSALGQLANPFDGGTLPGPYGLRVPAKSTWAPAPLATEQGSGPRPIGGWMGSSQARNPFDAGYGQPRRGLPQQPSPQAGPTPQAQAGGMPGAAAGAEAGALAGGAPAPGAAPGGEGGPGPPALPSATTPEAGAPTAAAPTAAAPTAADTFGEAGTGTGAGFGGTLQAGPTPFAMIGDITPLSTHALAVNPPGPPSPPGARGASPIYPSIRNFKISENQSPRPQDRVFFNFNYYNNVNDTINRRDLSPITQMKAYVYNFGIEKTFHDGLGSVGIRVPLDNLTANSFGNIVSTPTSTSPGNLTVFAKYILAQNVRTGSLVSAYWAITPQTGPGRFAGAPYLFPLNSTYFQTGLGYIYNHNKWYFQGFSGFIFPANPNDVSLIYNDLAIGYFLMRNQDSRAWLTALAPTFELHVNNPLNHRDPFNRFDLAGSPDSVDLTFGLNFGIKNSAVLTAAFVTPVASPKPFDSEAVLMLNIFYGRTRRTVPITPPPL
jgi:hypothetical protein